MRQAALISLNTHNSYTHNFRPHAFPLLGSHPHLIGITHTPTPAALTLFAAALLVCSACASLLMPCTPSLYAVT